MTNLQNKTAIITGSSRGLGKTTALELAKRGAKMVLNYRSNQSEAESSLQEILAQGGSAIAVKADVSRAEEVNYLFEKTLEHFGKIDIVVNNAGVMVTKLLKDFSEEEFEKQLSSNVKSVFLM